MMTVRLREHSSRWAVATWIATAAGAAGIISVMASGIELPDDASSALLPALVTVVSYGAAGAVLIDRRPDLPFGWLLAGVAVALGIGATGSIGALHAWQGGDTGLVVRVGAATTSLMFLPVAVQGLVNVRFPSGQPTSLAWRYLDRAIGAGTAVGVLGGVIAAAAVAAHAPSDPNDVFFGDGPPGSTAARIGTALQVLVPVVILLGLVAGIGVVIRYRRAVGIERQQLKWRATGVVLSLALFPFAVAEVTPGWLDVVDPLFFVVTLAIPVLRYRLWAIDTLMRRSVVYALSTVVLLLAYLALTALGTTMMSERVGASVAAVAVAVAFAPLRARVQQLVDHVAYGDRRDPYRTISDLDRRLGEIAAPGQVLPTIVETVGISLRLPYVGIERRDGSPLAAHGQRSDHIQRWGLVHEGKDQGFLVASPRRGEAAFDDRDRDLLSDVARHAGVAVHAEVLTADLIASRQRLVTTREEERRRLRRDLHDGLGPTLTGIGLNLDAARSQLSADPETAGQLIREAKEATSEALADVRRLVYGLRPPALDNLGLVGAIEQTTGKLASNGCRVRLDATNLPDMPAAIEVAAYRTVVEAVTNAIRHGHAHNCVVRLHAESGVLEIDVDDDGISTGAWDPGVGLLSMHELAAELDGAVEAGPIDGGGSRVSARYPILAAET